MKLPATFIFLVLMYSAFPAHGLTLTEAPLTTTYETPPPSFTETIGTLPLAIGGGLLTGLLLFGFWKIRRDRRSAGLMLLFVLAQPSPRAAACANIEASTLESSYTKYLETIDWFSKPVERALEARPADDPHISPDPSAYPTEPPAGIRENDAAVRLVLKGNVPAALEMLLKIEDEHPGLYATAANLGTCYELSGDDEKALHWIEEGLQRNPYSHMLAEWLHVRVLEAKIALKSDPSWLDNNTITGLDLTRGTFETSQGIKDSEGVLASLRSQCTVRALFIKPQDPVMGQLLYEAATFMLEKRANGIEATLALAVKYGLPRQRAMELQARANEVLKNSASLGRPSALGVWLSRWKYPLIFIQALLLGLIIPMAYILKKESADND